MSLFLGSIYSTIELDTSKLGKDVRTAKGYLREAGDAADNASSSVGNKLATGFLKVGKAAGVAAIGGLTTFGGVVAGMTLKGGIARALNIEDAQAKLRGLGHDAKSVTNIMESALASVKGTAYGLDSAATIAAGAVAAGIKPGKELTRYLKMTADAATIAGTSLSEMGPIMNRVQTQQRAYTMELNMLADRGIPIYQWLQKELGVSAGALRDMVAAGEIDSATYFKVIEKNIGGAALESGKTTRGAWENMKAAMSRVGAEIVKDIIPQVRESFGTIGKWFDDNSPKIVSMVGNIVKNVRAMAPAAMQAMQGLISLGTQIWTTVQPAIFGLGQAIFNDLLPGIKAVITSPFAQILGTIFVAAIVATTQVLTFLVSTVGNLLSFLAPMTPLLVGLTAAFVAYRVALVAINAINILTAAYQAATNTQYILYNGALIAARTATIAQTAAQTALNVVMAANPIGLVIAALGGLVGAFIASTSASDKAKTSTDRLNEARQRAKTVADELRTAEDNLKNAQLSAEGAALAVERAERSYAEAKQRSGATSLEAREAEFNLKRAKEDLKRANEEVGTSTDAVKEKTKENKKAQDDAAEAEANRRTQALRMQKALDNQFNSVGSLNTSLNNLNGKTFTYTIEQRRRDIQIINDGVSSPQTKADAANRYTNRFFGGPVRKNQPYLVGENRDGSVNRTTELFIPKASGTIMGSQDLQRMLNQAPESNPVTGSQVHSGDYSSRDSVGGTGNVYHITLPNVEKADDFPREFKLAMEGR